MLLHCPSTVPQIWNNQHHSSIISHWKIIAINLKSNCNSRTWISRGTKKATCKIRKIFLPGMWGFKKKHTRQISSSSSCQDLSKNLESFDIFPPSYSYWEGLDEILKGPFEMDQSWQYGYLVTPSFSSACFTISLNRPFVLPLSKLWSLA